MVRLFLICFICVVFLSSCSSSSKRQGKEEAIYYLKGLAARNTNLDKKVCILAAGQSNIDGRVAYALMPEYLKKAQPLKNTFYVKNDIKGQFAPIDIKDEWAFDLVTYYHFSEVVNDDLYIIKWTEGGTSIDSLGDSERHWTAEWEHIERGGGIPC